MYGNEVRDNDLGLHVFDQDPAARSLVHDNFAHDNDVQGISADRNTDVFNNIVRNNDGTGVTAVNGALVRDNNIFGSVTGIFAEGGAVVRHNRVFGNSGSGIVTANSSTDIDSNIVFGNGVGLEITNFQAGPTVRNNLVYDNANQGIFVHDAVLNASGAGVRLLEQHRVSGRGQRDQAAEQRSQPSHFQQRHRDQGGFGIEVIGGVTGFESDYNDVVPWHDQRQHRSWLGDHDGGSRGLACSRRPPRSGRRGIPTASPRIRCSSTIDGADNLLGWDRPTPLAPFADFSADDNFHLRGTSPLIDRANSDPPDITPTLPFNAHVVVAPATDQDGLARADDPGTANAGAGPVGVLRHRRLRVPGQFERYVGADGHEREHPAARPRHDGRRVRRASRSASRSRWTASARARPRTTG